MSFEQIKALTRMGGRANGWSDYRGRSPKDMGDMSGVLLSQVTTRGTPAIQEFDYDVLSKIYICNDLAWTCINLVSSTAAMAKLKVRQRDGKTFTFLPDHPLQKMLDFPNNSMTQFDLIQSYVTHQLLYGNVSMILLREAMLAMCPICQQVNSDDCEHKLFFDNTSPIVQIMPVHPSNLDQEEVTIDGQTKKYFFYKPKGNRGPKYIIHPDNILTDPFYNPDVSWYGVSPTFLLQRWLKLDTGMTKQVTDFFDNGAIPSMIVSMKPGAGFTYEQEPETLMEMMKEKWLNRFAANGTGAKTPAFVYGDVQVQQLQEKINDTIGKELYYEIQNRVCATYGVPPSMYEMGLKYGSRGTGSGSQHEKDFYNNTIIKILSRFKSKIMQLVVPSFNTEGLEVEWDLSDVGIAAFITDSYNARIQKHWELGLLQRDTTLTLLGYEPVGGEYGDDFYRLTVMSDGSNDSQAQGMDNRLAVAQNDRNPPTAE